MGKRLTAPVQSEICSRYLAGENTYQLGTAFGVVHSTIGQILKRNGVKVRNISEAQGGLNPAVEPEVCRRYLAGESTAQLGNAFGVSCPTINRILKRNGVEARSNKEAHGGLSAEVEVIVCTRYLAGENTIQLSNAFGVCDSTIGDILKRNGVKARRSRLGAEVEAIVCSRYLAGESTPQLGNAFGVPDATIGNILRRNGVKARGISEAMGGLDAAAELEICSRYLGGENTIQLGNAFGVVNTTIGNILKRHNVEARSAGIDFGDSVQHILNSTGLHAQPR